ncbi:3'-5' exonuclease [Streptomyces sp. NPDC090442]|uniref:3'-5' exonuclease n=1 Tax=Streptomyces sp. NPDC090442 TaxID=3365962 RepID=UPI00381AE4FA
MAYERERAEREAADRRELLEVCRWAADALSDSSVCVLDTETTGLAEDARIVEIAVVGLDGRPLLERLVNPGIPIPPDATEKHKITDEMVSGAPSFSAIVGELTAALDGRRVLIYNKPYDVGRLRYELTRHYVSRAADAAARSGAASVVSLIEGRSRGADGEPLEPLDLRPVGDAAEMAAAWLDAMRFEDAMVPYSRWVGEWDDYHGNYRWQRLHGGHRAAADCRAVLECLVAMRKGRGFEFSEGGS